jgi:hypothetical protein
MSDTKSFNDNEEIFSKKVRAGRRTYFIDVRSTKADDYYVTITESKKYTNEDGSFRYKKHKIYLYKEDFVDFKNALEEVTDFVVENRGEEVISERHQSNFLNDKVEEEDVEEIFTEAKDFTNVEFEDL